MARRRGWRWIVDYHVIHWDIVVLRLPGGQPVGSNGCHLLVVLVRPYQRALEREEAMVGSSGVDRRIGMDAVTAAMAGATVYIAMVGGDDDIDLG